MLHSFLRNTDGKDEVGKKERTLIHNVRSLLPFVWCLWPVCTWATGVTLGETLVGIPLSAWLSVLVLSLVSGLLAILQKMNQSLQIQRHIEMTPDRAENQKLLRSLREGLSVSEVPSQWGLFVAWHMAGSALMGAIAFLFLEATDVNDFIESAIIALASYGGAKMVDKVSAGFSTRVLESIKR